MFYSPLALFFLLFFFFILLIFFAFVQVNIIALAFARIGIPNHLIFLALFMTLLGSFINIPIKTFPQEDMVTARVIRYAGFRYLVPARRKKETVLALNLGGAVIPVLLSIYLLFKTGTWFGTLLATGVMTFVTYRLARPVRGVGIALPPFAPPIAAAVTAVVLGGQYAPMVAYVSGTVGTLIGADILNLEKIRNLGAPVASIGGAGTFDGIFLNGILAVLLAALFV